jgi:hypothetical protein
MKQGPGDVPSTCENTLHKSDECRHPGGDVQYELGRHRIFGWLLICVFHWRSKAMRAAPETLAWNSLETLSLHEADA